jgi:hypothetical protein
VPRADTGGLASDDAEFQRRGLDTYRWLHLVSDMILALAMFIGEAIDV